MFGDDDDDLLDAIAAEARENELTEEEQLEAMRQEWLEEEEIAEARRGQY